MSILQYNGINLQVCRMLRGTERTPIFDGPQYLYTRWRINCRCLYNPAATSYFFPVVADVVPGAGPVASRQLPATTDVAIRHRLMLPRKQLILGVGNTAWLVSPQQAFTVDSSNGPTPLFCNVIKGPGGRSFVVDYGIETCLRECNLEKSTYPSIFLSHRWEMRHSMDSDGFFTDRIIRGHVIFDTARLAQGGVVPDQYRGSFFHPIPPNFQRTKVDVSQSEDGKSVFYAILDEEQEINIGAKPRIFNVTSISGYHASGINKMSVQDAQMGMGQIISSVFTSAATTTAVTAAAYRAGNPAGKSHLSLNPLAVVPGEKVPTQRQKWKSIGIGAGMGLATGLAGMSQAFGGQSAKDVNPFNVAPIPTATHELSVTVQGNSNSFKAGLQAIATQIIDNRIEALIQAIGGLSQAGIASTITYDLKAKSVTATIQVMLGPRASKNAGNMFNQRWPKTVQSDQIDDFLNDPLLQVDGLNPAPPADKLSRGTFLEYIVTQTLTDPCNNQGMPPANGGIKFGTVSLNQNQITAAGNLG